MSTPDARKGSAETLASEVQRLTEERDRLQVDFDRYNDIIAGVPSSSVALYAQLGRAGVALDEANRQLYDAMKRLAEADPEHALVVEFRKSIKARTKTDDAIDIPMDRVRSAVHTFQESTLDAIGQGWPKESRAIRAFVSENVYPIIEDSTDLQYINAVLGTISTHIGHAVSGRRDLPQWQADSVADNVTQMARDMLFDKHVGVEGEAAEVRGNEKPVTFRGLGSVPALISQGMWRSYRHDPKKAHHLLREEYLEPDKLKAKLRKIVDKKVLPKLRGVRSAQELNARLSALRKHLNRLAESYTKYGQSEFMGSGAINIARAHINSMIRYAYDACLAELFSGEQNADIVESDEPTPAPKPRRQLFRRLFGGG